MKRNDFLYVFLVNVFLYVFLVNVPCISCCVCAFRSTVQNFGFFAYEKIRVLGQLRGALATPIIHRYGVYMSSSRKYSYSYSSYSYIFAILTSNSSITLRQYDPSPLLILVTTSKTHWQSGPPLITDNVR